MPLIVALNGFLFRFESLLKGLMLALKPFQRTASSLFKTFSKR
jgi:hypothetical protein